MFEAVIFDVDGTLIDSVDHHARSWQETLRHFGFDLPFERIRQQIGKGADQLMPALLPQEVVDRQGPEIEAHRLELFKREYLPQVRPFPAVRELFERLLADDKRIALATSAKADELTAYEKMLDIANLFDAETSADDANRSKPHPDIFEVALGRIGPVERERVVVVGDTPYDAQAASRAGLRTVGLLSGGFPEEQLRESGCFAIYRDPADLLARYEDSPLAARP